MINDHLLQFTLHLADNALIIGHRNSEWCGHGPVLEQDIALSNISLDYIGQARNFYQYAAQLQGNGVTEDSLAYLRDAEDFKNCLLVEMPNGDWAQTIVREFLFSTYQYFLYQKLQISTDQQLSAIAEKALKEVTYHVRWSSEWVIRLGDGTEESKQRMEKAIEAMWPYTNELFIPTSFETAVLVQSFGFDLSALQATWNTKVKSVFEEATLCIPDNTTNKIGGKDGIHTEYLTSLLEEMQFLQRTNPGAEW